MVSSYAIYCHMEGSELEGSLLKPTLSNPRIRLYIKPKADYLFVVMLWK